MVKTSEIVEDKGDTVIRKVSFGPNPPITEHITQHHGTIIYFNSPETGHAITNTLSYDENNELVLTYSFAGGIPGLKATDTVPPPEELNKSIGRAVDETLVKIRELVENGRIKAKRQLNQMPSQLYQT
ncbi:hypothetical protein NMY22_g2433 [Coprinellus aureogranulatus]|nr:hypothetical protein NMY22_g2433 [Coprinellus aureogranulatus]